jgi:hypothetical protein
MRDTLSAVMRNRFGTAKAARGPAVHFSMAVTALLAPCSIPGAFSQPRHTGGISRTNSRRSMHADL